MTKESADSATLAMVEPKSPDVYNATMDPYRESSLEVLNAFEKAFAETSDCTSGSSDILQAPQFLDIACGAGNFTFNVLLSRYQAHCRRIVAVDNAPNMIRFAKSHHQHKKIVYQTLDIVDGDVDSFVRDHGLFERIFCFNLLHWVKDRARALKNIEKLLAPSGECFILFQHRIPVFDVIMEIAESERWKKYAKVCQDSLPPLVRSTDFSAMRQDVQKLLGETNMKPLACEVLRLPLVKIPCLNEATDRIVSFNPIYPLLNEEEKKELHKFTAQFLSNQAQEIADGVIPNRRFAYVIHAYKPAP